ncbi:MAG: TonB-dependent receptor, partial [Betaproteobacteria bacterium]|nr:TonB-dependent receptor [Betaproteobacteria bacterium]
MNTKLKKIFWTCCLLVTALIAATAWGSEEKAEFSIHLFQNGLPVADAELSISSESFDKSSAILIFEATPAAYTWRLGSDAPLKTNANGSLAGKLPPGVYQFTLKTKNQEFIFDLPLRSAENAQILVTFYPTRKKPLLNIESSVAGTMAGTVTGEPRHDQGEG